MSKIIDNFQKKYPTKAEKETALRGMSDAQIDRLIDASTNVQAKIFYSKFRSEPYPHKKTKR